MADPKKPANAGQAQPQADKAADMSFGSAAVMTRQRPIESDDVGIRDAAQSAADAMKTPGVQVETVPTYRTDELDFEHFMRDELEVILSEPNNEHEASFVEINVNGDYRCVLRNGDPVKLRRYHVAVLAQAKQSRVRQKKIVNADGSMGFQEENVLSLTYPFSVIADPNPRKGAPWLREMLRTPA